MNILHVTPAFMPAYTYGGPIAAMHDLCISLIPLGCDVKVLTTDGNGDEQVLDVEKDREVEFSPHLRVRYCSRIWRQAVSPPLLSQLPRYVQWADVVHLHGVYSFPTIPTLLACRLFDKPVVWSPHGVLQRWKGTTRTMLKEGWERLCRTVAPHRVILHTTSDQEAVASRERFPNAEVVTIPFGVHVPHQVRQSEGGQTLRLLFVGRLHPKKGVEHLLEACVLLRSTLDRPWSLTVAGDGSPRYVESLRARVRLLGLEGQVSMVGEVLGTKKDALFSHADIVVVPSYTENFAVVVSESLARAVPVIASSGTPWQRVEEFGCGLWVDNTPASLSSAIQRMSHAPLREMGQRGREWLKREFRWDASARAMMSCYEHACQRTVAQHPPHVAQLV